ncbi:MAG: hypothetical protein M3R38_13340 [Actinomycetota bacterium]|nr:hypothetical protein [Actinomycetota bacterium]
MEPYAIALLALLASAVAAVLFTVAVVVAVDRTVNRERRGTAGLAGRDAGEVEPGGGDVPGAGRAGGEG